MTSYDRRALLNKGALELYHATSGSAARQILDTEKFEPGTDGLIGAGIYFSRKEKSAVFRRRHGDRGDVVVLTALVDLAWVGVFPEGTNVSADSLASQGIHAAKVSKKDIFMVLDNKHIHNIRYVKGELPASSSSDEDSSTGSEPSAKRRRVG
ncbi:unnamed protein product [Amoebophrya sp. A25]|nr:unnamed protein product [Amoebophrya sp. A25]|eukprot:GSA25T00021595001.1